MDRWGLGMFSAGLADDADGISTKMKLIRECS